MTKNITMAESISSANQEASSSQVNQNIDLLMMLNFMTQVASSQNQILANKEQARKHREFRKPKGMSNAQVRKRSNDRAAKVASPKVNRNLLQIENSREFSQTEFSTRCSEIIDRLNLAPEDQGLLFNLTEKMRKDFSDNDLRTIYNSLKDYQTGIFVFKGISPLDILNHTASYGLKAAVQSSHYVDSAVDIISSRALISGTDAKRLLDGIYNALKPDAENFITACVSSKPEEDELAEYSYSRVKPFIIMGSIIGALILLYGICHCYEKLRNKLRNNQIVPIIQNNDFDYAKLDELIKDNNFEVAKDFLLIKEEETTNEPRVIINCLKRVFFESDEKFNKFSEDLKERLEELPIASQNKNILARAIEVGIAQRVTIAKIANILSQSSIFPNIYTENVASFLEMKDRARMACVTKPKDDLYEHKAEVKIDINPSSNPSNTKYKRLGEEIEMGGRQGEY